jgi:hypothetical protein
MILHSIMGLYVLSKSTVVQGQYYSVSKAMTFREIDKENTYCQA